MHIASIVGCKPDILGQLQSGRLVDKSFKRIKRRQIFYTRGGEPFVNSANISGVNIASSDVI